MPNLASLPDLVSDCGAFEPWHRVTTRAPGNRDEELVLREFSNTKDNGEYENMVKLPTSTLADRQVMRTSVLGLSMHEGQVCCTTRRSTNASLRRHPKAYWTSVPLVQI